MTEEEYIQKSIENQKVYRRNLEYIYAGLKKDMHKIEEELANVLEEKESAGEEITQEKINILELSYKKLEEEINSLQLNMKFVDSVITKHS
tara:strand:+ start:783 stop:1055 length:273 start_codon:yes stop_codon:yes gene_type:complete